MARRQKTAQTEATTSGAGSGSITNLTKELWQAAVMLRGSIEPADYKRYVLPIIFLRFLSLRYEKRRAELEAHVADEKSDYFGDKKALEDPDEYRSAGRSSFRWMLAGTTSARTLKPTTSRSGSTISLSCWRSSTLKSCAVSSRESTLALT
jgi:type I restriction-modification system DNA methylase subunit